MKTEQAKKMYELELHEQLEINETCYVMRVIGGWIYKHYISKYDENNDRGYLELASTTFVPWNNEMQ